MKWFGWTLTCLVTMAASAGVTGWVTFQALVGAKTVLPGTLLVDHRYDPALHGRPAEWLEMRRRQLLSQPIYLKTPDDVVESTFGELGLELDMAAVLDGLNRQAREGSPIERLERAVRARRGQLEQPALFTLDETRARSALARVAKFVERPAINAKLDVENHRRIESRPGRVLDIQRTLGALAGTQLEAVPIVATRQLEVAPEVTTDMLADIDVSKVLASFETSFRNKAGNRAINIRTAAGYLNGTIVPPGGELSFNKIVGPRDETRGFVWAPVIVNDEMEPGVGGGVCQVATTLHAAAVLGWLDVEERRSHSRPSGYAPLGLDATVIYGKVDLKIKNPYDTALMVHAFLPSRYTLRIELLGREPPGHVKHAYAVTETHDFTRRVASKSFLEPGHLERRQKGTRGYDIVSVVTLEHQDGTVDKRRYRSKYYPVPEVYWVPEGSNLSELPELPEGASHTEHVDDAAAGVSEDQT